MKVGIFGSGHKNRPVIMEKAKKIGRLLAENGCEIVTGGAFGLPHQAAMAAKDAGAKIVAFGVGLNAKDHLKYHGESLLDYSETIFQKKYYTGELSVWDNYSRSLEMINYVDVGIVLGGRVGTMYEVTILSFSSKDCFVLKDSGGVTHETIERFIKEGHKGTSKIVFFKESEELKELMFSA